MAPEEALKRAEAEHETLLGEGMAHLLNRPVAIRAERRQDGLLVSLDAVGLAVTAKAFGRASPCSRSRARHRLTLAALTPNRSPAARWVSPPATAAKTRTRRSSESAVDMPASLQPGRQSEITSSRFGNPIHSDRVSL